MLDVLLVRALKTKEKRLGEYKLSKDATWLERRALEHANSVNAIS